MAKQQKMTLSIPAGTDAEEVQCGLVRLALLLECTGRGQAPSASALVVRLGELASDQETAMRMARALSTEFGLDFDAPIIV